MQKRMNGSSQGMTELFRVTTNMRPTNIRRKSQRTWHQQRDINSVLWKRGSQLANKMEIPTANAELCEFETIFVIYFFA